MRVARKSTLTFRKRTKFVLHCLESVEQSKNLKSDKLFFSLKIERTPANFSDKTFYTYCSQTVVPKVLMSINELTACKESLCSF